MKPALFLVFLTLLSASSIAAAPQLERASQPSSQPASEHPHILFVNVNQALAPEAFNKAVSSVVEVMPVYLATDSAKKLDVAKLFQKDPPPAPFGKNTKFVVYVVNVPQMIPFASAPKQWSLVNVSGFDKNIPASNKDLYGQRLRKLMLKGLALACGAGPNHDSKRCVMASDSFTPDTIDSTGTSYSPFADAPIQSTLSTIDGIFIAQ